ncbi:MAG: VOC family protein [Nitrososphaeria archaeon]
MAFNMVLNHVTMLVDDLGRSVHFYSKILGLPVVKTLETQDRKTVFVQANTAMISLSAFKGEREESSSTGQKDTGIKSVSFRVQNVEEAWKELLRKGVIFTSAPETAEGGYKKAAFTDPNGIVLELVEWPEQ